MVQPIFFCWIWPGNRDSFNRHLPSLNDNDSCHSNNALFIDAPNLRSLTVFPMTMDGQCLTDNQGVPGLVLKMLDLHSRVLVNDSLKKHERCERAMHESLCTATLSEHG